MPRTALLILLTLPACKGFLDVDPPGQVFRALQFEDVTEAAGITGEGPSYGAGWGDPNGDGWPDVWSGNHADAPSLFVNQGDGTFVESRASLFTLDDVLYDAHGVAFADLDGDGDEDLLESVGASRGGGVGRNRAHVQAGGGFTDQAGVLGLDHGVASGRCPIVYDWNEDGRLDVLFMAQPKAEGADPTALFTQTEAGAFVMQAEVPEAEQIPTALCGMLADLDGDLKPEVVRFGRPGHVVAHSATSGSLEDVTEAVGLPGGPTLPFDVVVADLDNDLDNDLFVTRWQEVSDFEIDAEGGRIDLSLRLLAEAQGVSFRAADDLQITLDPPGFWNPTMIRLGADCSAWVGSPDDMRLRLSADDADTEGICKQARPDTEAMFVGRDDDGRWEVVLSAPVFNRGNIVITSEAPLTEVTRLDLEESSIDDQRTFNRDRLYLRQGDAFVDDGWARGIQDLTTCTSVVAADLDNDMDLDLYLVCARPLGNTDNLIYANDGAGRFTLVADHGAEGTRLGRGDTVIAADYDRDGMVDLFVTNGYGAEPYNRGPRQLFRNVGLGLHWIELDLVATATHPDALGATVRVTAGGVRQQREVTGGTHHMGQHHRRLHFGLADHEVVDEIEITWPGGGVTVLTDVDADQVLEVVED